MARLPVPGGDDGSWGEILNEYLSQSHNADGSLKSSSVFDVVQSQLNAKVTGPTAALDGAITRFDGTNGKILKGSSVYVSDDGKLSIGTSIPTANLDVYSDESFPAGISNLTKTTWIASASATNSQPRALYYNLRLTGDQNISAMNGITVDLATDGNASITSAITGISINPRLNAVGSVKDTYGYRSILLLDASSTGTVTRNVSFEARTPSVNGRINAISQSYGIWIAPQQNSGVVTGFGVYQTGANDLNYFNGKTGFATNTPHSHVHIAGSLALGYTISTGSMALDDTHAVVEVASTAHVITLPTAVDILGRVYCIINTAAGSITINTTVGQAVGNTGSATSYTLASGASVQFISNGTAWRAVL